MISSRTFSRFTHPAKLFIALLFAVAVVFTGNPAHATDLPAAVKSYLTQKDPNVTIRFDGMVIFSNGTMYLPVTPQDPETPEPVSMIHALPEGSAYPDLVQFDNNFFLIRLIQTDSGRLTTPPMDYPVQLKEGMLPQDLVLPDNLFLPAELKVILGQLPYNPVLPKVPASAQTPEALRKKAQAQQAAAEAVSGPLLYMFDIDDQILTVMDAKSGRKKGDINLNCVPSTIKSSADGKLLYAACLTTNELVVVDVESNLVKTRVPAGDKPGSILLAFGGKDIVVGSRFASTLTTIDADTLLPGKSIAIPGNGGVMTGLPDSGFVFVADAFANKVYLVDLRQDKVYKTYSTMPNISALWVYQDSNQHPELWVASRTQNQVQAIDVVSGNIIKTFDVGAKPVDFAVDGTRLYVLSAGKAELDVIDWQQKTMLDPIALEPGSFPSSIALLTPATGKGSTNPDQTQNNLKAYIGSSGNPKLFIVNLAAGQLENTMPLPFRASPIALVGGPDMAMGETASKAPATPLELIINGEQTAPATTNPITSKIPFFGKSLQPGQPATATTPDDGNAAKRGSLILQIPKSVSGDHTPPANLPPLFDPSLDE